MANNYKSDEGAIASLVREMAAEMLANGNANVKPAGATSAASTASTAQKPATAAKAQPTKQKPAVANGNGLTTDDYPLAVKHPEKVKSYTGKTMEEITLNSTMNGSLKSEDIRISAEVLECQAQIAESTGKKQLAENFRRAAELTRIPDEEVLRIYDLLRPNRATKAQLLQLAQQLKDQYGATGNAKLVEEAVSIYEKRGILLNG